MIVVAPVLKISNPNTKGYAALRIDVLRAASYLCNAQSAFGCNYSFVSVQA